MSAGRGITKEKAATLAGTAGVVGEHARNQFVMVKWKRPSLPSMSSLAALFRVVELSVTDLAIVRKFSLSVVPRGGMRAVEAMPGRLEGGAGSAPTRPERAAHAQINKSNTRGNATSPIARSARR